MGKRIGDSWKRLSDEERTKFQEEARVDKERYNRQLEAALVERSAKERHYPSEVGSSHADINASHAGQGGRREISVRQSWQQKAPNHPSQSYNPHGYYGYYGNDGNDQRHAQTAYYARYAPQYTQHGTVSAHHYDTANAFSPPVPTNRQNNYPESPDGEFAFQCEVCGTAVFSTYNECAEHERECGRGVPSPPPNMKNESDEDLNAV